MYDFDIVVDRESTNNIKYDLREKIFEKADVIPMWVADMDFETPDFIRKAIIERAGHPIYGYSFRPDSYYNSITKWLKTRHNWEVSKDWIVYSPGIVPALNFCTLAYTNESDNIIVQPPVYFPFFNAATDHNRNLIHNELLFINNSYEIDFDDLHTRSKDAKMLFLSNPHNPVGRVFSQDELLKIGNICIENKVIIISDEIHSDLILPAFKHIPIASLSEEIANITVTCIAPSKTFNLAGMATSSVIISNNELREKFESIINKLHLNLGNIFGAVASEAGYNFGADWVDQLMKYINSNVEFVKDALKNSKIDVISPEATYLIWLNFNNLGIANEQISQMLINDAKVGLSDGSMFGLGGKGFQRMNLACPRSVVETAIKNLLETFS